MARELSDDPYNVRRRMRNAARRASKTIHAGTVVLAEIQYKPIEEWDLEELAHGRPRAANGGFSGRITKWITPAIVSEAKKRHEAMAYAELSAIVPRAVEVIREILTGPDIDPKVRLDAAKFASKHVVGKPKVRVEVGATEDARNALLGALVIPDGAGGYMPAHPVDQPDVIDATVVEDDDRDDDGPPVARDPFPERPRRR